MKKAKILICDDESGVRESLKVILGENYTLAFATNGEEVLESLSVARPDLVILDIKMPKLNGLEALKAIKTLQPALKVLMITGYEASDVAREALRLGADSYLAKPFDREKIRAQIQALLG